MYSFIPSWYTGSGMVRAATIWANYTDGMEFDDTVNQLRIFRMAGEETELVLLGCVPELRRFMHRQGVECDRIWSAFDVIQDVGVSAPGLFSYLDFKWPKEIEWFNTPFLTVGYLGDKLLVKVIYGIGGHTVRLEWYNNDLLFRSDEIDDRGFISYRTFYEDDRAVKRVYFSDRLKPRVTEDLITGRVSLSPDAAGDFARDSYGCIGDLVEEVLREHFASGGHREIIAAYDTRHNGIVCRAADGIKLSCSVFSQRSRPGDIVPGDELLAASSAVVTDTEYLAEEVRRLCPGRSGAVLDISPYDARLSPGTSGNIRELKLLFYIDSWNSQVWRAYFEEVLLFMKGSPDTQVTVCLGRGCAGKVNTAAVETEIGGMMERLGLDFAFERSDKDIVIENEDTPEIQERIFIRNCRGEQDIIELLGDHRLVIDISPEPDLYLLIAGMSACIPMVIACESRYVSHTENGWIVSEAAEMHRALSYFLDGLSNWNRAFVASLGKIGRYTDGSLVASWKRAMNTAD